MDVQRLMSIASGEMNFRILRVLHEKPMYSDDLAERLSTNARNVRVHLHHLRQAEFVEFRKTGKRHLYSIKTPFQSKNHRIIMSLVARSDSVSSRGETIAAELQDLEPQSRESHLTYLQELFESYLETFVHQSPLKQLREMDDNSPNTNK